jgi:hypothetical protein
MTQYYSLIAGLPELTPEDEKMPFTLQSFKDELRETLSDTDYALVKLYFMQYDNANLLAYLQHNEAVLNPLGELDAHDFDELAKELKETDEPYCLGMPEYFKPFWGDYLAEKNSDVKSLLSDKLSAHYYLYASRVANKFIANWFEFNMNLQNLLAAHNCRKYNLDVAEWVVGDNYVSRLLKNSTARDFGLSGEFENVEEILRMADEQDILLRERRFDQIRWNWLDENSFFNYFTIERVFSYLVKLGIIERWQMMDSARGGAKFKEMVNRFISEITFPAEIK